MNKHINLLNDDKIWEKYEHFLNPLMTNPLASFVEYRESLIRSKNVKLSQHYQEHYQESLAIYANTAHRFCSLWRHCCK